jgi:FdhD protein
MVTETRTIKSISLQDKYEVSQVQDELALDEPVCIFVNDEYQVTLIASPENKNELAIGYLLSENIIDTPSDLRDIDTRDNNIYVNLNKNVDLREVSMDRMNLIVTACGANPRSQPKSIKIPKVTTRISVYPSIIMDLFSELTSRGDIHLKTRGTHSALLGSIEGEVLTFAEDVGRHNAVDKVVGSLFLMGGDLSQCILLSTGRQSGEMVLKAARAGIPVVSSMTVPLTSGVRLAEASGITLTALGLGSLKVYSNPGRIKVPS